MNTETKQLSAEEAKEIMNWLPCCNEMGENTPLWNKLSDIAAYKSSSPEEIKISVTEIKQPEYNDPHWDGLPDMFQGVIIKHDGGVWGQLAIRTLWGNYALVQGDEEWASKHIAEVVTVKPRKEFYKTVQIVHDSTPSQPTGEQIPDTATSIVRGFVNAYDVLNYNINSDLIETARKFLAYIPPPTKETGVNEGLYEAQEKFWNYDYSNYGLDTDHPKFNDLSQDVVNAIFQAGWEAQSAIQSANKAQQEQGEDAELINELKIDNDLLKKALSKTDYRQELEQKYAEALQTIEEWKDRELATAMTLDDYRKHTIAQEQTIKNLEGEIERLNGTGSLHGHTDIG